MNQVKAQKLGNDIKSPSKVIKRKVGYDVWQSVVRAFVSCAADEERVVGSDSREES